MADLIHTGSVADLQAKLARLPDMLAGRVPGMARLSRTLMKAVGIEALAVIKEAYVEKARGGTDAAGIRWKELSPRTIAYGRRHPGLNSKRGRAQKAGRGSRPLLTARQDQLWRGVFASAVRGGASNADAAARAWAIVKAAGGKTILKEYGGAKVEIGRDTSRLVNSLSPGAADNVLDAQPGSVRVGTNCSYAKHFHAIRPMWPSGDWPQPWQARLAAVVEAMMPQFIAAALKGGG